MRPCKATSCVSTNSALQFDEAVACRACLWLLVSGWTNRVSYIRLRNYTRYHYKPTGSIRFHLRWDRLPGDLRVATCKRHIIALRLHFGSPSQYAVDTWVYGIIPSRALHCCPAIGRYGGYNIG